MTILETISTSFILLHQWKLAGANAYVLIKLNAFEHGKMFENLTSNIHLYTSVKPLVKIIHNKIFLLNLFDSQIHDRALYVNIGK